MQEAFVTPQVEEAIQRSRYTSILYIESDIQLGIPPPPLSIVDARRIIDSIRENSRLRALHIFNYNIHNDAVLNEFLNGLQLCTSITTLFFWNTQLGNEGLEHLLPAFYNNTTITKLSLAYNQIQGQCGGEIIRDLIMNNNYLLELSLGGNHFGLEGAIVLGQVLTTGNITRLQKLSLCSSDIDNKFLENLVLAMGEESSNDCLMSLNLGLNNIEGAEGGRLVVLLLQHCPKLKLLDLCENFRLGPPGAWALAPALANLETLQCDNCLFGSDDIVELVPHGQENRSLTELSVSNVEGILDGEYVVTLVSRCMNLERLTIRPDTLNPDQQRRLDILLERKRLCKQAQALAGSPFPVLFRFVEDVHRHELGLSAIFVILQNDGDDYFCNAHNRTIVNNLSTSLLAARNNNNNADDDSSSGHTNADSNHHSREEYVALQSTIDSLQADNEALRGNNRSLQTTIESLQAVNESHQARIEAAIESHETFQAECQAVIESHRAQIESLQAIPQQNSITVNELHQDEALQSTIESLQVDNEALRASNESFQAFYESLQTSNDLIQQHLKAILEARQKESLRRILIEIVVLVVIARAISIIQTVQQQQR